VGLDDSSIDINDSGVFHGAAVDRGARRILAVGGGKGGAGKSLLAANVAIYLATLGKRVVLLDADLGGANLHTFVGVDRPQLTIGDLFEKRVAAIDQLVVETPIPGLGLVSGEGDPSWIANARPGLRGRLLSQVQQLKVDYLVVDLGPGSGSTALDFFLMADVGILVVQPEPTSVENTYRFLKSAFLRRLRRVGLEQALARVREGDHSFEGGIPAPLDLYLGAGPELAPRIGVEMRGFRARIVVNQVRARSDLDLGPALASAARRRLGIPVDYLGHLEHDDAVWLAVRKRRPLFVEHPESRAAKNIERIARRLLALENEKPPPHEPRALTELSHYEILEVEPAATDEDIRRAVRRVRDVYGADSLVLPGLYTRERLAALHVRIDEAYETLIEEERRRAYDQSLFPDGQVPRRRGASAPGTPSTIPPGMLPAGDRSGPIQLVEDPASGGTPAPPAAPRPPEPEIGPATEFSGALLRQLREARGIDLHAISQRTKITVAHLRAIEEETVKLLPAMVYVRGFLVEYARFLRLDVARVLDTYLARLKTLRGRGHAEDEP
jgi:flagellar biosynthesis protein FlhG